MKIRPFNLERYFAKHEFEVPYLLSCSDPEPLSLRDLLSMAGESSLNMWEDLSLGYTESQGHPVLREEISKLYPETEADELLVLAPEEGIFVAMNCLLEEGDHVVTTFPGYQSLYEIANSLGCEVSRWLPEEGERWSFDLNDLKKSVKKNTELLVINFPHNPTGATIEEEELREIIKIAENHDLKLFSDEMYRFLEYEEADRLPPASTLHGDAVSLCGMSKSFSLAGLRIGWLTTKNSDLLDKFISFKDYTTICNAAPAEILAIIGLKNREEILTGNVELIRKNLEILNGFFENYSEIFKWLPPRAGSVAFPKLRINKDVSKFCSELREKKGTLLLPSEVLGYEGNYFRIGLGREDLSEGLEKLEEYLEENYF